MKPAGAKNIHTDHRDDEQAAAAEAEFDQLIVERPDLAESAARSLSDELRARGILFGDKLLPTCLKPHLLPAALREHFVRETSLLFSVIERVGNLLFSDSALKRELSKRGEMRIRRDGGWRLMGIDPGFAPSAIVCRPDMLWTGDRLRLIEFNADSPAMMTFADRLQEIQRTLFPMKQIEERWQITYHWRTRRLYEALLSTYAAWGGKSRTPTIAIVDWPEQKTRHEQELLARELTRMGCPSFTCHPGELSISGGRLHGKGEPIDIVQRRVLFTDFLARASETAPLLKAYEERMVCMINPLRSYFLGSKMFLSQLCMPLIRERLSQAENEVVTRVLPHTFLVTAGNTSRLRDREHWVLKPAHGHGGSGVLIGAHTSELDWTRCLEDTSKRTYVAQEFQPIPRYRVPWQAGDRLSFVDLYANWAPFIIGGQCAGDITRVSSRPIVGISADGALLPCVTVGARR